MPAKLKDIAHETGFSINTVARALRRDMRISAQTRELVQAKALELGYIRNVVAGSMRSNKTQTIGVVSADSSNPFFAEVILGVEEAARSLSYSILLINTEEKAANEREAIKLLLGRQVDGLVIVPVFDDPESLEIYRKMEVPFIFVGRRVAGIEGHSILHGDNEGQDEVVNELLDRGHRNILYLAGPGNISSSIDRLAGFHAAYRRKRIELDPGYVLPTSGHLEDGYAQVNRALNRGLSFTAVACFNDLLAMGALKSLHENNVNVPADAEVFGYDNLYISQFMQPRLSTVDVPKSLLGRMAVEELVNHIEDDQRPYRSLNLKPRLVFRETTSRSNIESRHTRRGKK